MREIKFRAWDTEEKVMGPVSVVTIGKGCFIEGNSPTEESFSEIGDTLVKYGGCENGHFVAFPNAVLMQYTGLKDKNEKEIWEGDIVKVEAISKNLLQVFWRKEYAGFRLKLFHDNGRSSEWPIVLGEVGKYEVIGNIYESPELLK